MPRPKNYILGKKKYLFQTDRKKPVMRLHSKKVETINNSISIKNIEKLIYCNDNTVNTRSAIFEFDHLK